MRAIVLLLFLFMGSVLGGEIKLGLEAVAAQGIIFADSKEQARYDLFYRCLVGRIL